MHDVSSDSTKTAGTSTASDERKTQQRAVVWPLRILAACAVVAALQIAAPVIIPIVLAGLLFYALDPVVDRIEKMHVPRLAASVLVVLGLVTVAGAGGVRLWPQFEAVVAGIPEGAARLRSAMRNLDRSGNDTILGKIREATKAIDAAAAQAAPVATTPGLVRVEVQQPWRASDWLWARGLGLMWFTGQTITVLFLTIFLLNEDDRFKRKLVSQMETLGSKRVTVQVLVDIATQIKSFLWVQTLTSTVVAVATGITLWMLGLNQPAVWGLFAGVLNIVPYFGPLVVTAVLSVVAFLQFGTLGQAALIGGVAMAITTFEGMFLTPHLLSRATSLNHVAIFVAIAFWGWAWGIPGVLLAVPMLMAIKAVCDHVEGLKPIGEFLEA
jgi:predicted PurR-regulated permease PerM